MLSFQPHVWIVTLLSIIVLHGSLALSFTTGALQLSDQHWMAMALGAPQLCLLHRTCHKDQGGNMCVTACRPLGSSSLQRRTLLASVPTLTWWMDGSRNSCLDLLLAEIHWIFLSSLSFCDGSFNSGDLGF